MDAKARRKSLRLLTNGMYVMSSHSGDRYGAATVTWVSQASFRPPLIMAAVRRESNVFECLRESRVAAIHILGQHQQDLAQRFFAPTTAGDGTINGEPFTDGVTSAPILKSAPAYLEGWVRHIIDDVGDHAVVAVVDGDLPQIVARHERTFGVLPARVRRPRPVGSGRQVGPSGGPRPSSAGAAQRDGLARARSTVSVAS